MSDNQKVRVINGEHTGKVGVVTSMFWGCNIALITTDDGEDIAVAPSEIVAQ